MRRVLMVAVMLCLMTASAKAAGDGVNFGVLAPPDWTPSVTTDAPDVLVKSYLTENGVEVPNTRTEEVMVAGSLRDINAAQFVGTNKTVCVNASAQHLGAPTTEVVAEPLCFSFQFAPLTPPILQLP